MMKLARLRLAVHAALAAALLGACGDSPTEIIDEPPLTDDAGSLEIVVEGLPDGADADLSITGPGGFSAVVRAGETFADLPAGTYPVTIRDVSREGLTYGTEQRILYATVVSGETATLRVQYRAFNLTVESLYITQSVQKP
ncbi:MAG: hypothetical protein WD737_10855, partial [Gemmatimonadota bacterium]